MQPHVAVDPLARIPARRGFVTVVVPHGDKVVPLVQRIGHVVFEIEITVQLDSHAATVDPDLGSAVNAFEFEQKTASGRLAGNRQVFAIPADVARTVAIGTVAAQCVAHKRSVNRGIVGQLHRFPPPVVVSGTLGAGLFAQPEAPVEIQQFGAALPAPGHRQGQQQAQQKQS